MGRAALIIFLGAFSLFCAVMNFDWFMESRRARIFVGMFGRDGARIFYGLLGLALMGLGGGLVTTR